MFVEEYLEELRRERFRPLALARYLLHVARRSRDHMIANPGAVRSIWSVALGFFAVAFVVAAALALHYPRSLAYAFFEVSALGIVTPFVAVTCYVGALRDRDGYPQSAINLATALTLLRVAMVPGITLFLVRRYFGLALGTFIVAALTDVADGWIARRFRQITRLGTVLDPVVDVVFNLAILTAAEIAGLVPLWVLALAALRYVVLVLGGAYLYLFVGPIRIQPTLIGRLTGVLISALFGFLLLLHVWAIPLNAALAPLTVRALGVLLGCTVAHVLALGWYNLKLMTGQLRQQGRVVGDIRYGAR